MSIGDLHYEEMLKKGMSQEDFKRACLNMPDQPIIKDDGSGYGSHLPILRLLFSANLIRNVVEFGMGNFSTEFFLCKQVELTSIEQQDENWLKQMLTKERPIWMTQKWETVLSLGATSWRELVYPEKIDLCFVDGHLDARADCVNFMFNRADIIVCHDFECPVYNWGKIQMPDNYKKIIYHDRDLQTAVFIHTNRI